MLFLGVRLFVPGITFMNAVNCKSVSAHDFYAVQRVAVPGCGIVDE